MPRLLSEARLLEPGSTPHCQDIEPTDPLMAAIELLPPPSPPRSFEAPELEETQRRITSDALAFPADADHLSADAKALLSAILVKDPEGRLGLEAILAHPWLAAHQAA